MAIFAKIIETGSFTSAGKVLGIARSTISRVVQELELKAGTRLLQRTTRTMALTEAGDIFHRHCLSILDGYESLEASLTSLTEKPKGHIRICAPVGWGQLFLPDIIKVSSSTYPDIKSEIYLTNRRVDLIEEKYDIVIRIGPLQDSSLVARRLGSIHQSVCASADYLERMGSPKEPKELIAHHLLCKGTRSSASKWEFRQADDFQTITVTPEILANDSDLLLKLALYGLGIARLPTVIVQDDLRAGRLRPVLKDWSTPSLDYFAIYPNRRGLAPKIRLFLDLLADHINRSSVARAAEFPIL